ncbi:DUF552 domain-containing protein [Nakamurella antarctica]|uniref:Cell division protein SepF n=1 Tax=Nakamurella antarctica TaxID=1902245 RepID=A0A3G8ZJZ5_9ACTN|nr:cell division protein SepF [Nakamurella antarctica]AZI57672.1 DUF552 domain-containing protein [Nakamurella antarctica]
MGFGRKVGAFLGLVPEDVRNDAHHDDYQDFDGPDYAGEYSSDYDADADYRSSRDATYAGASSSYGRRDSYAGSAAEGASYAPRSSQSDYRQPTAGATSRSTGHSFANEPVTQGSLAMQPRLDVRRDADSTAAARPVTIKLTGFGEARVIGEKYRDGQSVIMDMTEMADADARRLVDFAAGLAFAKRGSIDKVTTKVFMLLPPDVDFSAEDRREYAGAYSRR